MPPPMPISAAWAAASSAVSTFCARPRATPAADSRAIRMTARPLADSQPKNAAPHLMPPKRACWAATASRPAPRVTRGALGAHRVRARRSARVDVGSSSRAVWSVPAMVGLLRAVGCGDPPAVGVLDAPPRTLRKRG